MPTRLPSVLVQYFWPDSLKHSLPCAPAQYKPECSNQFCNCTFDQRHFSLRWDNLYPVFKCAAFLPSPHPADRTTAAKHPTPPPIPLLWKYLFACALTRKVICPLSHTVAWCAPYASNDPNKVRRQNLYRSARVAVRVRALASPLSVSVNLRNAPPCSAAQAGANQRRSRSANAARQAGQSRAVKAGVSVSSSAKIVARWVDKTSKLSGNGLTSARAANPAPRVSRARLTGCSNHAICTSFCNFIQASERPPVSERAGSQISILRPAAACGDAQFRVVSRGSRTYQRNGVGATSAMPSAAATGRAAFSN